MSVSPAALAALAATASFAQSSVTISGTFDPSVQNQKVTYGNNASVSNSFIGNNGQGTSQITFKGVEDLGGGLKASFLLENDFNARYDARGNEGTTSAGVNGTNFGTSGGEQYLGLEGSFGKIQAGAANTPSLTAQASRNPFSTKIGSGFNGVLGTGHIRSNNSLVYSTPVFNGFSAGVAYGFKHNAQQASTAAQQAAANTGASTTTGTNTENQASVADLGLNYANGPFAAGVSYWETGSWTGVVAGASTTGVTAPKVKQTNLYATYDLNVAKLFAGYHTEKQDAYYSAAVTTGSVATGSLVSTTTGAKLAGADARGWNLGVSVPVNANLSLLANYGKLDDKLAARAAAPLNKKIAAVGLRYNLSKNTSLYARYVEETNDNIAAAYTAGFLGTAKDTNTAASIKTTLVGMQTNF